MTTLSSPTPSLRPSIAGVLALGLASLLSGCGLGMGAPASPVSMATMAGHVMGGEQAIIGANVILWQTDPAGTGYGTTGAVQLATTTTTPTGSFTFTPGYTCAPGQFVYITATGGNVSGSVANPITNNTYIEVAALGSCSNFSTALAQAAVNININEVSTVAAAYTLGNFMTINQGTGIGDQKVYISAPATNNATTGSCTGTGTSMSCTAAGLSHAFANAAILSDSVRYNGATPTGLARTAVPGNTQSSVPAALINTIADIIAYCTNSNGSTVSTDPCGQVFANAQPTGGTTPADTLTALIDIAKNPRHNTGTTCTGQSGGLFCLVPGTGAAFQPTLTAVPDDYAIAIVYTGVDVSGTSTAFGPVQYVALDANDNVYGVSSDLTAATKSGIFGMTSTGTGLWANAQSTTMCNVGTLATDMLGNVWETIGPTSSPAPTCFQAIYGYAASTGAINYTFGPTASVNGSTPDPTHGIQSQAYGLAVDRLNNVWYARKSSSCTNCLFEFPYTPGTPATYGASINTQGTAPINAGSLVIDASANVWIPSQQTTGNTLINVLPNTGTPNVPTYPASPGTIFGTAVASSGGNFALDVAGNVWAGVAAQMSKFTPTRSGITVTAVGSPVNTVQAGGKPYPGVIDGAGTSWYPSFTTSGQIYYYYTTQASGTIGNTPDTTNRLIPCYLPSATSTCSTTLASSSPKNVQVDSSGAVWVSALGAGSGTGYVLQILGPAAPAWPLQQYAVFAAKP